MLGGASFDFGFEIADFGLEKHSAEGKVHRVDIASIPSFVIRSAGGGSFVIQCFR